MREIDKHDMQVYLNQAADIAARELDSDGDLDELLDITALIVSANRLLNRLLQTPRRLG